MFAVSTWTRPSSNCRRIETDELPVSRIPPARVIDRTKPFTPTLKSRIAVGFQSGDAAYSLIGWVSGPLDLARFPSRYG